MNWWKRLISILPIDQGQEVESDLVISPFPCPLQIQPSRRLLVPGRLHQPPRRGFLTSDSSERATVEMEILMELEVKVIWEYYIVWRKTRLWWICVI